MPTYTIVQAPSHLGLRAPGVERLPEALLAAGLAEGLDARPGPRLAAPPFDPEIDPATGLLNPQGLRHHAVALADALGAAVDSQTVPIVLGATAASCSASPWPCVAGAATACCSWTGTPTSTSRRPSPPARPPRWSWAWSPAAAPSS